MPEPRLAAVVSDPQPAGTLEPGAAGGADRGPAAFVLVAGGHVADACVQALGVVLMAYAGQLGAQDGGVADLVQVRPVGLDVAEQALDPGLVGGGAGAAEVLRDRPHRENLPRAAAGHLRPVV